MTDKTDKSELLRQLRIDRDKRGGDEGGPRWRWVVVAIVALLIVLGAGALIWSRSAVPEVKAAAARAVSTGSDASGPSGASILDASGYVVARRQATVSAKITGKLSELFIEEGQHIKENEVVAKLDDTNAAAALMQPPVARTDAASRKLSGAG